MSVYFPKTKFCLGFQSFSTMMPILLFLNLQSFYEEIFSPIFTRSEPLNVDFSFNLLNYMNTY